MVNYNICATKGNRVCPLVGYFSYAELDKATIQSADEKGLIKSMVKHIQFCSIPEDEIESLVIRIEDETTSLNIETLLYSDDKNITKKEENISKIMEKTLDPEYLVSFLIFYLKMSEDQIGIIPLRKEVESILVLLQGKSIISEELIELLMRTFLQIMEKDYAVYRHFYLVDKSVEEEKKKSTGTIQEARVKDTQ